MKHEADLSPQPSPDNTRNNSSTSSSSTSRTFTPSQSGCTPPIDTQEDLTLTATSLFTDKVKLSSEERKERNRKQEEWASTCTMEDVTFDDTMSNILQIKGVDINKFVNKMLITFCRTNGVKIPAGKGKRSYCLDQIVAFKKSEPARKKMAEAITKRKNKGTKPSIVKSEGKKRKVELSSNTHDSVSDYCGKTLTSSSDLKTNACCTAVAPADHIRTAISNIHPEVIKKYYGCGFCTPDLLDGTTVLDLGCGAGRDVYIASQLVGKEGRVIGVDMTEEQLETAEEYKACHEEKFGYGNVEFHKGLIEELDKIESLEDNSVDVIISNCVINLCPDKRSVLESCHRILKPGGELYFSDVYSNRRVSPKLQADPVLWGECLSGALYWNDFQNLAKSCGFADPRLVEDSIITVENAAVSETIRNEGGDGLGFFSATYRLFKLDGLEPHCEDYGQAVVYKGTIPGFRSGWALDDHHYMETRKVFPVCGNTYRMLKDTRFEEHFEFIGSFDTHYGIFEGCGTSMPFKSVATDGSSGGGGGGGCC